jgi:hypothetical protein
LHPAIRPTVTNAQASLMPVNQCGFIGGSLTQHQRPGQIFPGNLPVNEDELSSVR